MADLVVRVYSKSGRSRLELSANTTYGEFKSAVQARLHVPHNKQIYRLDGSTGFLQARDSDLLRSLGINNTTILHLDAETEVPNAPVNTKKELPPAERTAPTSSEKDKEEEEKTELSFIRTCKHPVGQRCINCLAREDAARKEKGETPQKNDTKWMCKHPAGGKCINCLEDSFVVGIKHESFEHYMQAKRAKCSHEQNVSCTNCLPPAESSYKLKRDCTKHLPWPQAICNSCMPATAVLARQSYRHVDYVELMNKKEIEEFVRHWQETHSLQQRAGIMYGYYAEDPNYPDGVRAVVEAVYEPPQIGDLNGFQLLNDPYADLADLIAGALGFEKIGWLFTSINHDIFLSSAEIRQAAQFQQQHVSVHPSGYKVSKFVTVVLKPRDDGSCEPQAYMVSDQCQALERDNIFGDSDLRRKLVKRKPESNELLPTIMCENRPAEEFPPEWFIVQVGSGMPLKTMNIIQHTDFPVENREVEATNRNVSDYLKRHRNEPDHIKFSNFHLLFYIGTIFDTDTAVIIASCVANEEPIPDILKEILNEIQ